MTNQETHVTNDSSNEAMQTAGKRRKSKWKLITLLAVAASVAVVATIWISYELSQRRTVPDMLGATLNAATELISETELALEVDETNLISPVSDANTVIGEQIPAPGTTARVGDTVVVTVFPVERKVPNFVGASFADAQGAVKDMQFNLVHQFEGNSPLDAWAVTKQSVPAGSMLPAGAEIKLEFEVPEIIMPDVAGTEIAATQQVLKDLGLVVMLVGTGTHVSSSPTATGSALEPFSRVVLNVGVLMPDLRGMTFSDAKSTLTGFTRIHTDGHSSRKITSQNVEPGAVVARDAEIRLVSPGPETIYRVIGNGYSAMVTWSAPGSFSIQQDTSASLPWEQRFPTDSGMANFNAQILDGSSVTCQVERNGEIVKELTSTGPYAVVSC